MPRHGEVGAVELEGDARLDDGLVLRPHRRGQSAEVGLAIAVVLIGEEEGDHARRGGGHEEALVRHPAASAALQQALDVAPDRVGILEPHRADAGRRLDVDRLHQPGHVRAVVREVAQLGEVAEPERLTLEPRQPVLHVGRVALLALLAVVDDVDAGGGLRAARTSSTAASTASLEARHLLAGVAPRRSSPPARRPRQAARVSRAYACHDVVSRSGDRLQSSNVFPRSGELCRNAAGACGPSSCRLRQSCRIVEDGRGYVSNVGEKRDRGSRWTSIAHGTGHRQIPAADRGGSADRMGRPDGLRELAGVEQ